MLHRSELLAQARAAMARAYAPYSHFQVGAALEGASGRVYLGCNVENAAYSACNCAERTAFFKAVSEGERAFLQIAIVGGLHGAISGFAPPCGVCRQVMSEFCGEDFAVHLWDGRQEKTMTLGALLPLSFTDAALRSPED